MARSSMALLLLASAAVLCAFAVQTVTAGQTSSLQKVYYHCYYPKYDYCPGGGEPYCGKDGYWHYERSDCSGHPKSYGPKKYKSSNCYYGSGYWYENDNKYGGYWYYPSKTCYSYKSTKCHDPIDWSQCGGDWSGSYYGGPYCDNGEWNYSKCSYCNPRQRKNCRSGYASYCLYDIKKNRYAYDCCNCPANSYESYSDSCDDDEYIYCRSNRKWGCRSDNDRK